MVSVLIKLLNHIKAIIPVHIFGHPCDISGVIKIAKDLS